MFGDPIFDDPDFEGSVMLHLLEDSLPPTGFNDTFIDFPNPIEGLRTMASSFSELAAVMSGGVNFSVTYPLRVEILSPELLALTLNKTREYQLPLLWHAGFPALLQNASVIKDLTQDQLAAIDALFDNAFNFLLPSIGGTLYLLKDICDVAGYIPVTLPG